MDEVKAMLIQKILNNNVVITQDENKNEIIAMGKGLAFNKRPGDFIPKEKIDKVYHLKSDSLSHKFQELIVEMPLEYLEMADEIIRYAKEKLKKPLNDAIYISLTDHLYTAMERVKKGIRVKNVLLWDIRRFFPKEFEIGVTAIRKIKQYYAVDLSEDEAGFVALHLVNAQVEEEESGDMYKLTQTMQDILNIARYYFRIDFNEESVYFYRFTSHLRFFVSRILQGNQHTDETDEDLLLIVQNKYKNAYTCVDKIALYIWEKFHYIVSNDEKLYLTIHLARLVQKGCQLSIQEEKGDGEISV